jgi:hypothetical protein
MKFRGFIIGVILFAASIVTAEAACEFSSDTLTIEKGITMELAYSCDETIPFCTTSDPEVAQVFRNGGRWVVFGKNAGSADIMLYENLERETPDSTLHINVTNNGIQQENKKSIYHSGDDFTTSANDGSNGWMFEMSSDGKEGKSYTPLPKSIADGWYDGVGKIFCRAEQTSIVTDKWVARTFVAPQAGIIRIYDSDNKLQPGTYFKVLKNESLIYPEKGRVLVEGSDTFLLSGQEKRVEKGDKIRFCYIAKTSDTKIWTQQRVEYISFGENDAFTSENTYIHEGEFKLLDYFASADGLLPECTSSDRTVVMPVLFEDKWYIMGIKTGEAQIFLVDTETSKISMQTVYVYGIETGESSAINSEKLAVYENQKIPIPYIKGSEGVSFTTDDNSVCEILEENGKFYMIGKKEGTTMLTMYAENGLTEKRKIHVLKGYPALRQFVQNQSTAIENQGTEDITVFSAYAAYNDKSVMVDSDCGTDLIKSGAGSVIVQRNEDKKDISVTKHMLWESADSMKPLTDVVSSINDNP